MKIQNISNAQNFKGQLFIKGKYTPAIEEALRVNPYLSMVKKSKDDILCFVDTKKESLYAQFKCGKDSISYKVFVKKIKNPAKLINKVINLLTPNQEISTQFHSEYTTLRYIRKRIDFDFLKELGFKI